MSNRGLWAPSRARALRRDEEQAEGSPGEYYFTVVTQERAHLFGEVQNGEMRLSEADGKCFPQ